MAANVNTVHDAMVACGVDNITQFHNQTSAQRIAEDVFDNDFMSCIDKDVSDLEEDLKTYSGVTVAQGQIRLLPGTKRHIKAFIQWAKDLIRTGQDPSQLVFPVAETPNLMRRQKSHSAFCDKSKRVSEAAKPSQFDENTKWTDWCPVSINFLKSIPGRHGHPLSYVVRDSDDATMVADASILDDYINRAPLVGDAFDADISEVHTYIVTLTAGNATAESKLLAIADQSNGRLDFKALQDHYEGVGINAIAIREADNIIATLEYTGERRPTMWWDEFEKKLTMAFVTYDKREKREVYSNEMKLRILCQKVNADFLHATRQIINIDLTRTPVTMTYEQALASFRNEVNRKFPPDLTSVARSRRMAEIDSHHMGGRGRGRGRGRFNGRGRGRGRSGRGGGRNYPKDGARYITGINGESIEVHPAFSFTDDEWYNIPPEERRKLSQERQDYRENNKRQRINEVTTDSQNNSTDHTLPPGGGHIMGGRNEQAALRKNSKGGST